MTARGVVRMQRASGVMVELEKENKLVYVETPKDKRVSINDDLEVSLEAEKWIITGFPDPEPASAPVDGAAGNNRFGQRKKRYGVPHMDMGHGHGHSH
uniref:Uncharacterized protein n=1 Tax=Lotharella globosa TaxID=91324 RepID=A0A7S3Z7D7_9EUKA|eukprot:CAMPEP_0167797464 /NCGR_PEP_ID=MMETSP0111_2-20121227/15677_1 /TAXON_ID=91324 /ORGANISM="Lotharella globosa, Strain CCCM811" /LENGTH=97 /DNA_ID=CAMNT_0007691589 /DNA_START=12 /DNA_END=305 /DNA_ORIENTATION=-